MPEYDVIIVGGRPAGASLAARLGAAGLNVLILERDTFPSYPAVSIPLILSSAMKLLDEIGAKEEDYAGDTPKLRRFVLEYSNIFRTFFDVPDVHGRDYMIGLDRAIFDEALWKNLARFPTVTARQNFAVTDLIFEGDQVVGINGQESGGAEEEIRAKLVVGADGRFSIVARKVDAPITEERSDVNTTIYYAYWQNVAPYEGGEPLFHIHTGGDGYSLVLMPSAGGRMGAAVQCRQDYFKAEPGQVEQWYLDKLKAYPAIWKRLEHAERVTPISGMKGVRNLYRQAGGAGWALVGDAVHQKDSIDAQGIYDALIEAKRLAESIVEWHCGRKTWEAALADYEKAVHDETHAMFEATLGRLQREVYSEPPPFIVKTVLRWLINSTEYKRRFGLLVTRSIDPDKFLPPPVMIKALLGGIAGDVRGLFSRKNAPLD